MAFKTLKLSIQCFVHYFIVKLVNETGKNTRTSLKYPVANVPLLVNALIPYSDQHQTSSNNINAYSTPEVIRIKDMFT